MNKKIIQLALLVVFFKLSVCSAGEWFYGTWRFDRDFSLIQLTNYTWKVPQPPSGVPDWVAPNPLLVFGQLQEAVIVIETNAFTFSVGTNSHTTFFTVLSRPSERQAILKSDNGETNTVRLVKDHLEFGKVLEYRLYFQRASK
jgi:hypothetical protein